jgi:hypothetical protein
MKKNEPHAFNNNVTTHTAQTAYDRVLDYSGASLKRDAVDLRVIDNVRKGEFSFPGSNGSTNGIIDTQSDAGGWPLLNSTTPPVNTAGDGIPDDWKIAHKLDPARAQANGHDLSTAYDNIEVYMNDLVRAITESQNK